MLRRVVDNCDAMPAITTGDAGYFSVENVRVADIDPFANVASDSAKHTRPIIRPKHTQPIIRPNPLPLLASSPDRACSAEGAGCVTSRYHR